MDGPGMPGIFTKWGELSENKIQNDRAENIKTGDEMMNREIRGRFFDHVRGAHVHVEKQTLIL